MVVGAVMNCFEWQNRVSDYLDGTLIGSAQREAEDHLESCRSCNERQKHYRLILSTLSSQPRSTLPVPIRKSPLGFNLPKLDLRNRKSKWEQVPWFVRTGAEGLGIATLILFVVALVPRIRTLYEQSIERRLDAFSLSDFTFDTDGETGKAANVPLSRGKIITAAAEVPADGNVDEFTGGENESASDDSDADAPVEAPVILNENGKTIRVGDSEIWRFNMKTDSPHEIRPKIVHTLSELRVSASTPGFGGIEAPGGIQFDLMVPKSAVPGLKQHLEKLAQQNLQSRSQSNANLTDFFTWYKNKSNRKIPGGKTRVVIWLSQM